MGLKVTKVHRVVTFKERAWMKPWIMKNTKLRAAAKNDFEAVHIQKYENTKLRKSNFCQTLR